MLGYEEVVKMFETMDKNSFVLTNLLSLRFGHLHTTLHFSMLNYDNLYSEYYLTKQVYDALLEIKDFPNRFEITNMDAPFKSKQYPDAKVKLVLFDIPIWLEVVLGKWNRRRYIPHVTVKPEYVQEMYEKLEITLDWTVKEMSVDWAKHSLQGAESDLIDYQRSIGIWGNYKIYDYSYESLDSKSSEHGMNNEYGRSGG